jgi:putative sporulation protein YyaC
LTTELLEKWIIQKKRVPSYIYRNKWQEIIPSFLSNDDIVFLCIGTNRCTGDAFGPMVGTYLQERGYKNVYGTIHKPVHHLNLQEAIEAISSSKKIIAIDAAVGKVENIGYIFLERGPIEPGKGVGKMVSPVGEYHIKGIVNVNTGFNNQMLLMTTPLDRIIEMAKQTAFVLTAIFPRNGKKLQTN